MLATLAGGCKDADPTFADAAAVDAAVDGPGTDATDAGVDGPGGDVIVHVRRANGLGTPDPGATVFHAAPDGTVLATLTPDAAGVVALAVTAGDSITVRPSDATNALDTVLGVEPGDELWFGRGSFFSSGQMTVTVPEHPTADTYMMTGPCVLPDDSATPQIAVGWWDGCAATRTVVAVAVEAGTDGRHQMFAAPLTVAAGGQVTLDRAWVDSVDDSVALVNVPAGEPVGVAGGLMIGDDYAPMDLVYDAEAQAVRWQRPPALDEGAIVRVVIGDDHYQAIKRVAADEQSLDVALRVPAITSVVIAPQLTWTVAAPDPIDAFVITTAAIEGGTWTFVAPPDARTLVRPQIPGAPLTTYRAMHVVDVAGDGYDEFRPDAGHLERYQFRKPPVGYDIQILQRGD